METYVVRLSLPDRPGVLGAVAVRVGAVRGNVVGIAIVERCEGEAIDEMVIELPSAGLVELLVQEITQVDGVHVELVEPIARVGVDPRLQALEAISNLFRDLRRERSRRMHPSTSAGLGVVGPAA